MFVGCFVGVRCIIAIRLPHFGRPSAALGVRFIAPAYTCSPRIRNPFRIHSRNVRNVFVICMLHIRHAKVWFLFFECCVVAICLECYHNPFAAEWQSVRNVLAIRQQHFGNPLAAVGVRFIVPAYTKTPIKWGTEMCVR